MMRIVHPEHIAAGRALAEGQTTESRPVARENAAELLDLMLSYVPGGTAVQAYSVVVPHGKAIQRHDHEEWVVLYYVEPADTPVEIDGAWYMPVPGEILVIPAHTMHSVQRNSTDQVRISVALKARI